MGSIFQLGAVEWLVPLRVAEAVEATEISPLLTWAQQVIEHMEPAGLEEERVQQFQIETKNLDEAAKGDDQQKGCQARERLALLIRGIKSDEEWGEFVTRANPPQIVPENFAFPERSEAWAYVFHSQPYIQSSESLKKRIRQAFYKAPPAAFKVFVKVLKMEESLSPFFPPLNEEQMTALTYLLEEEEKDGNAIWRLLFLQYPLKQAQLYRTYLKQYTQNLTLPLVPYSSLSEGEKIAIYALIKSMNRNVAILDKRAPLEFSIFDHYFHEYLKVEYSLAEFSRIPVSLISFIRRLFHESHDNSYPILSSILERSNFVADEKVLRVAEIIFQKNPHVRRTFRSNIDALPLTASLDAAIELLEMDLPFDGELFRKYHSTPDREEKIQKAEQRARTLVSGAEMGDWEDPFERIAIHRALGGKANWWTLGQVLGKIKIPNRSAGVYCRPFTFSVELVKPFYDVANKGVLADLRRQAWEMGSMESLKKGILNFSGNRAARRYITPLLQETTELPDESVYFEGAVIEDKKRAFNIVERILKTLKDWVDQHVLNEKACREIEKYVLKLLTALAWYKYEHGIEIAAFEKHRATAEETYTALDRLSEFYNVFLGEVERELLGGSFPMLPSLNSIQRQLAKMNEGRSVLTGEIVDVTLFPGTGKLDAFYGYMSDNCLAKSDWALHGMSDSDFVPYRILVNGEWLGAVQTFTKEVSVGGEKKKILIVTGVDPQLTLTPNPERFLNGLEEGFRAIAREGGYDLVVAPALEFAQSSRRALLRTVFRRYREKVILDEPIGFPQIGVKLDGSPKYYNDVKHREFFVFK